MFGLMLKSTHEEKMRNAKASEIECRDRHLGFYTRQLNASRFMCASLRGQIEEMTPDYELGKKRRAQYEKHNAKRKERRAAKRAGV